MQELDERDVDIISYRGSGNGGQKRNVTDSAVLARHLPTGLEARSESQRSWWQNRQQAMKVLRERVEAVQRVSEHSIVNQERISQIGIGDRPSHDWTWCAYRDKVTDRNGNSCSMKKVMKGRGFPSGKSTNRTNS